MLRNCVSTCRLFSSSFSRNFVRLQSTTQLNEELNNTFSIFPRIQDVNPEDLLGGGNFNSHKYFVERSSTGNLPVYTDYKSGGNKLVTEIRKITGNIVQLRNDLQAQLPNIPKNAWKIRPQSKKIVIEGNVAPELKRVLRNKF